MGAAVGAMVWEMGLSIDIADDNTPQNCSTNNHYMDDNIGIYCSSLYRSIAIDDFYCPGCGQTPFIEFTLGLIKPYQICDPSPRFATNHLLLVS